MSLLLSALAKLWHMVQVSRCARTHTHTHTHLHTCTLHSGNAPSLMELCSGGGETSLPLCGMAVYEFVVKMAESSSMHRVDKMADWIISYVKIH